MDGISTGPRCELPSCPAAALETWQHLDRGDNGHDPSGCIVQFCRHHGREFGPSLFGKGFRLVEVAPVPA